MPEFSGVENAIRELQQEQKKLQEVISSLKRIQSTRSVSGTGGKVGRPRKRLSAQARRRISEAAKKRWAAQRAASKGKS